MPLKGVAVMRRRSYDQCMRCGKATASGRSVCRECNPAQSHATVFLAVLLTLVVLGVLALVLH